MPFETYPHIWIRDKLAGNDHHAVPVELIYRLDLCEFCRPKNLSSPYGSLFIEINSIRFCPEYPAERIREYQLIGISLISRYYHSIPVGCIPWYQTPQAVFMYGLLGAHFDIVGLAPDLPIGRTSRRDHPEIEINSILHRGVYCHLKRIEYSLLILPGNLERYHPVLFHDPFRILWIDRHTSSSENSVMP